MQATQVSVARLFLLAVLCVWSITGRAVVVDNLHEATVAAADPSEEATEQAFAEAFKQVVIKVSGLESSAEHQAVQEASGDASRYAAQFGYVGDGDERKLKVSFVPGTIERILTDAGLPVWGGSRPAVAVWLAIEQGGRRSLIGSDSAATWVSPLEGQARQRGLPLVIPLMDLEDTGRVSTSEVWGLFLEPVQEASARYPHDSVLVGRVQRSGGQWSARWQLAIQNQVTTDSATGSSADEVLRAIVNSVTEQLASRYTSAGLTASQLQLEVSDVDTLKEYASLSRYLSSLTPVRTAQPVLVQADRIRYRLELNGSVDQLQEYLRLERRLRPVLTQGVEDYSGAVLRYRWEP